MCVEYGAYIGQSVRGGGGGGNRVSIIIID